MKLLLNVMMLVSLITVFTNRAAEENGGELSSSDGRGSLPVAQWKQLQEAVYVNKEESYCEDQNQFTQFGALMARISRHSEQTNISLKKQNEEIQRQKKELKQTRGTWTGFFTRYGLVGLGCFGLGWAAKSGALSSLAQKIGIPGFSE
jgi:hypothetical protein